MTTQNWRNWDSGRLAEAIQAHNQAYWDRDAPTVSDYEYDQMVEQLRHLNPQHPILDELGGSETSLGEPVHHDRPMLSLDKAYDEKALLHWASKFAGELVMSPKIDGVACSIKYRDGKLFVASTRGNGRVGEDITQNVLEIIDVPRRIDGAPPSLEVRGEVYMPLSQFDRFKAVFANPRNATAGALKQKNPSRIRELGIRFMAYDVDGLEIESEIEKLTYASKWGFTSVEQRLVTRSEVQSGYEEYVARRDNLNFEIDGVVFKANLLEEHRRLGETAHHPRYAIAYKLQGDSGTTVLEDVEWSVSRTGVLTPVGIVSPVELSGAVVTRITLHHWGMVQSKNLSIGAQVVAMRRGGVIPHLEHVIEAGERTVDAPSQCPSCGGSILIDGDWIRCPNTSSCPSQAAGVLAHYAKAAGIEGFGDVWLEAFVGAGLLKTPADFYRLSVEDLVNFDRMGETLARKLVDEVEAACVMPLATFLFALGISEVGKSVAQLVAETFSSIDAVRACDEAQFQALPKVGPVVAKYLRNGLLEKSALIDELLTFVDVQPHQALVIETKEAFREKSFLFTGTLTAMKRSEAQALVKSNGGIVASSVSKNLSYLVVGAAGSPGSKLAKAQATGVTVISEQDFLALLDA